MAISGKVTAATVAAALSAVVAGIVAPHVFPQGTPSDVAGLYEAVVTAGVTFVSGYLARHGLAPAAVETVAADLGMPFSSIPEAPEVFAPVDPSPVPLVVPASVPPVVPAPVAPVAQAVAQPLR